LIMGGRAIYSCTLISSTPSGSGLTLGTTVNPHSCLLGGVSGAPNVYVFTIQAEDSSTPPQTQIYTLTLTIGSRHTNN